MNTVTHSLSHTPAGQNNGSQHSRISCITCAGCLSAAVAAPDACTHIGRPRMQWCGVSPVLGLAHAAHQHQDKPQQWGTTSTAAVCNNIKTGGLQHKNRQHNTALEAHRCVSSAAFNCCKHTTRTCAGLLLPASLSVGKAPRTPPHLCAATKKHTTPHHSSTAA
jgi:hypothetical protein